MKKHFAILLGLAFLAAPAVLFAAADVGTKGMKSERDATRGGSKKGKVEKVTPADKSQKGGKKGAEKVNTPAKTK